MQVLIRAGICDTDEAFAAFAKGAARNADDLLLIKQAVAELDAAQAEAADVGKDIERAVRAVAADAVDFGKAVKQDRAAALKGLAQLFAEFRVVERDGRRVLAGRICAGIEVLLALGHTVDDLRRGRDKADAPAGHGIGLRETVDDDGALLHAREGRNAGCFFSGVKQCVVDVVGDHQQVVLHRQLRDLCQRFARHDRAGGVVRGVDHQRLGVRRDELFDGLRLHFKIMLQIRGNANCRAVAVRNLRNVVQPLRVLDQDLVALVQQDKEQQAQCAHAAVGDDDLRVRVVVQILQIGLFGDGLTERERTGVRRIMRDALVERFLAGLTDQLRRRHIRLTDAETDDAGHGICAVEHGADGALLQSFGFFIDPFHDADALLFISALCRCRRRP